MDYLEVKITLEPKDPWSEILVAELAEIGFESFVTNEDGVSAYAPEGVVDEKEIWSRTSLANEIKDFRFNVELIRIPHQNWNATWEADFQPVEVEDYLKILAPFHDKPQTNAMIVEIQPQMSFGTGHHQTTWMMSKALFELGTIPEKVLDMGTGTGVLAIIAEKLGAKEILAIDIEDWSVENAKDNAERNNCSCIKAECGDVDLIECQEFGLILANINKNVLKRHLPDYYKAMNKNALLLLSGFFTTDENELITLAESLGLQLDKKFEKETWAALQFAKR